MWKGAQIYKHHSLFYRNILFISMFYIAQYLQALSLPLPSDNQLSVYLSAVMFIIKQTIYS